MHPLYVISIISALIPVGVYLRSFKIEKPQYMKLLFGITLISLASDFISLAYYKLTGLPNYWLINIYGVIDAFLLVILFYSIFKYQWIALFCLMSFLILFSYSFFYVGVEQLWGVGMTLKNLAIMLLTILSLYFLFKKEEELFMEQNPIFWILIALLTYTSGSLFSWLLSSDILKIQGAWKLHNVANILKNILFAIGLWKARVVR